MRDLFRKAQDKKYEVQFLEATLGSWMNSRHLLIQRQQWKDQSNLFQVNNNQNGLLIIKLEQITHIVLVLALLTLSKYS